MGWGFSSSIISLMRQTCLPERIFPILVTRSLRDYNRLSQNIWITISLRRTILWEPFGARKLIRWLRSWKVKRMVHSPIQSFIHSKIITKIYNFRILLLQRKQNINFSLLKKGVSHFYCFGCEDINSAKFWEIQWFFFKKKLLIFFNLATYQKLTTIYFYPFIDFYIQSRTVPKKYFLFEED